MTGSFFSLTLIIFTCIQCSFCVEADPMADMMLLMSQMMDTATDLSSNCANISDTILDGIDKESQRIVSTAQKIDDMGLEIGYMSDKIVYVDSTLANLTSECFCKGFAESNTNYGNKSTHAFSKKIHINYETVYDNDMDTNINKVVLPERTPVHRVLSDWDPILDAMNRALILMDEVATSTTSTMNNEIIAIGSMSNQILKMEDQIMVMAEQIGVMADRITTTVDMMSSAAETCCPKFDLAPSMLSFFANKKTVDQSSKDLKRDNNIKAPHHMHMSSAPDVIYTSQDARVQLASIGGNDECRLDPFCWASKTIAVMIDTMTQGLASLMIDFDKEVDQGTKKILDYSNDILDDAAFINSLGELIGHMADCIVDIEKDSADMFSSYCPAGKMSFAYSPKHNDRKLEGPLCHTISPVNPISSDGGTTTAIDKSTSLIMSRIQHFKNEMMKQMLFAEHAGAMHAQTQSNNNNFSSRSKLSGEFGDFTAMVDLCTKMCSTVTSMSIDMMYIAGDTGASIAKMTGKIGEMVGKINQMVLQINAMTGRINQLTADLTVLEKKCTAL